MADSGEAKHLESNTKLQYAKNHVPAFVAHDGTINKVDESADYQAKESDEHYLRKFDALPDEPKFQVEYVMNEEPEPPKAAKKGKGKK
ncbi:unnamed protein product [Pedinophyceae sp. YPF-701]|nr:unnamed protein product [Pedinophyceae sp. YPF-701]